MLKGTSKLKIFSPPQTPYSSFALAGETEGWRGLINIGPRRGGVQLYSLYLSERGVELYSGEDVYLDGRLICSQQNYQNIVEFGKDLAWHKGMPFINHVALETEAGADIHD